MTDFNERWRLECGVASVWAVLVLLRDAPVGVDAHPGCHGRSKIMSVV